MSKQKEEKPAALKPQEKIEYICRSSLASRGWSAKLIEKLLPAPVLKANPHYPSAGKMQLWDLSVVKHAEKHPDFLAHAEHSRSRRERAAAKKEGLRDSLKGAICSDNPALAYPCARAIKRHFILCAGPTNSGKTYRALEALKQADSGVYLAPLRLLAMEIQDTLLEAGVQCSMRTGEEELIVPGSTFMSSTVEMLDLNAEYDVGVIDECQMVRDPQRGGAWTRAILGLVAPVIYLCMSENAVKICIKLIEACGDTYEIVRCERKTPLVYTGTVAVDSLRQGDALILFSRSGVLNCAQDMNSLHRYASVIYGALPYKSRREQVGQYLRRETDYVVATDAIGMGLNLPVRRIVFVESDKFDGTTRRKLKPDEVLQIAGRAGRFGVYDRGEVAILKEGSANPYLIRDALSARLPDIKRVIVPFPDSVIDVSAEKLSKLVETWRTIQYPAGFVHQDLTEVLDRIRWLEANFPQTDRKLMYRLACVPLNDKDDELRFAWNGYCGDLLNGRVVEPVYNAYANSLDECELAYKQLDLYFAFCKAGSLTNDVSWIADEKESLCKRISSLLLDRKKNAKKRVCAYCGYPIPF